MVGLLSERELNVLRLSNGNLLRQLHYIDDLHAGGTTKSIGKLELEFSTFAGL